MQENSNPSSENTTAIVRDMKTRLEAHLTLYHFEVKDLTGRHLNHNLHEGGFHLEAVIVSDDFKKNSLVSRHQLIYQALDKMIKTEIHALSIKALSIDEYNN